MRKKIFRVLTIGVAAIMWNMCFLGCLPRLLLYGQTNAPEPITVNGDNVEYSTDNKEVSATGNVSILYKGAKLTCEKLLINTVTKDAQASGNVRLEDSRGVVVGESLKYNFQNKTGIIVNSNFRSNPYFLKTDTLTKVSDLEYTASRAQATTCSYDDPHYHFKSKKINFFPGDKIQAKNDIFYIGNTPVMGLSRYNHSLKDPLMHVQVTPGRRKDWGYYMLTGWRYNLTDTVSGRLYLDYRDTLGVAEGFGSNYKSEHFGKGDFLFYYTHEQAKDLPKDSPAEFERYLIRWRHKWDIDERTNLISEYYKITDSKRALLGSEHNMLKDYFYREYEKDSQPLSYTSMHHSFDHSSVDAVLQKRVNRWYTQDEKLPEVKYNLPSLQLGDTPFYFENNTQAVSFNRKHPVPSPSTDDVNLNRFDTTNKFSLPMKVSFLNLTPFVMDRETVYDKDINGSAIAPRTVFYTGADVSTKFYRLFNVKSNFLGMDVNGLRHIITPSAGYAYNHEPTIQNSRLTQFDSIDGINRSNAVSLELSNKFQTKRNSVSVDMLDLRVTTNYIFKPKNAVKSGSNLSDFLFDLQFLPYSELRIDGDAAYKRSGLRSDSAYNHFSNANYDINFRVGKDRWLGLGQRYQRKEGNELTFNSDWRVSPKWKFMVYERYQFTKTATIGNGLRQQQYTLSRDLHCWDMGFSYDDERGKGVTVWLIFRLKAFPGLSFNYNQSYHAPKSGAQLNQ
jgi:LPS-assembly protein